MTTTSATTDGHQAARDFQRILTDLGAEPDLVRRVHPGWKDLGGTPHVYVPPLPAHLLENLARLLPPGVVS